MDASLRPGRLLARPALAVAADVPSAKEAEALARALKGLPVWLKVGLELYTAEGPALLRLLGAGGNPLFLDLKFHDIPNTVRGAVRSACGLGVSMLTVHLTGGEAMCKAALEGRKDALASGALASGALPPLVVGVTVLTSDGGNEADLAAAVLSRARLAQAYGLDGVVCSGREVSAVKAACGPDFVCVCPGIRFAGAGADDQARVSTPDETVRAGADLLVMGRPIIRAENPRQACEQALALMGGNKN